MQLGDCLLLAFGGEMAFAIPQCTHGRCYLSMLATV